MKNQFRLQKNYSDRINRRHDREISSLRFLHFRLYGLVPFLSRDNKRQLHAQDSKWLFINEKSISERIVRKCVRKCSQSHHACRYIKWSDAYNDDIINQRTISDKIKRILVFKRKQNFIAWDRWFIKESHYCAWYSYIVHRIL